LLGFISILVFLGRFALLITGIIICKKHSFMGGFYFFIILLAKDLYTWISAPLITKYIDSLGRNNTLPMERTIGELVAWLYYIPRTLEVIAMSFLVVGLYRLWKYHTIVCK
jgi:hypothetical protein